MLTINDIASEWYETYRPTFRTDEIRTFARCLISRCERDDSDEMDRLKQEHLQNVGVKRSRMGESQLIDNDHMAPGVVLEYIAPNSETTNPDRFCAVHRGYGCVHPH